MYLTDVLDKAIILKEGDRGDVPVEYMREQGVRMKYLIEWAIELEVTHRAILGDSIPFAYSFIRYVDYLIHLNTTGPKQ